MSSLADKKISFTKNLILEAACELTKNFEVSELSFKKVSQHAGVSERTMFRYYRSRDEFLDALTSKLLNQLEIPDLPQDVNDLESYVDALYQQLEQQPRKVLVLLSPELLPRVYASTAKARLTQLTALLLTNYPTCPQQALIKTAANIRYMLSASSWRHYRMYFNFDLVTCIECAQLMVRQSINHLNELNRNS